MIVLFNGDTTRLTHIVGGDTFVQCQFLNDDGSPAPIQTGMAAYLLLHLGDRTKARKYVITRDPTKYVMGIGTARIPWWESFTDLSLIYTVEGELCASDGVSSVTVTARGVYSSGVTPTISFGGPGVGAQAYANTSGQVSGVTGYLSNLSIGRWPLQVTAPPSGTTAAVSIDVTGGITAVAVSNGGAYEVPPVVTVNPPTSGSTAGVTTTTAAVLTPVFIDISGSTYATYPTSYNLEIYASDGSAYGTVYIGADGKISSATISYWYNYYTPGSPLTAPFSFSLWAYDGSGYYSITGTFDLQFQTLYKVSTVAVTTPGNGYTKETATFTIYGGTVNTAAVLTPTVTPITQDFIITKPGNGYFASPTIKDATTVGGYVSTMEESTPVKFDIGITQFYVYASNADFNAVTNYWRARFIVTLDPVTLYVSSIVQDTSYFPTSGTVTYPSTAAYFNFYGMNLQQFTAPPHAFVARTRLPITGSVLGLLSYGVDSVTVTSSGTGYTSAPSVTFSSGAAAATASTVESLVRIGGNCSLGLM